MEFDLKNLNMKRFLSNNLNLIPDSKLLDYFSILKFIYVRKKQTVYEIVGKSKIFETFWDPLTLGVMNTSSQKASAKILSNVIKKTILKGEQYCRIYQPKINWNNSIIDP